VGSNPTAPAKEKGLKLVILLGFEPFLIFLEISKMYGNAQ
jgi:hypothetical protein